jgi:outer membrane receptor protein involved in Fe transport
MSIGRSRVLLASLLLIAWPAYPESSAVLEEVVVSATRLREQPQVDVPASVTVITEDVLRDSAQQHFEEVMAQVPNLNWAAGSSRPRYFQIRGIGELEQYQGAPNSSVGFLIDDIDFSGIGMAATLFDISQIEVLRGPQGSRLGANALAGLIAVRSADPADSYNSFAIADVGNYDTHSLGFSVTGPAAALDSTWRLSAQKYRSDGFRTNTYLNRDDTNGRDEFTARGKWRWNISETSRLDLTLMHANLANGYDAFSIDNSRVTLSDHPGEDSQRVTAGAVKWTTAFAANKTLTAIATATDSANVQSYDGDWGNAQSWAPFTYDFVYRNELEHRTQTFELRFASPEGNDKQVAWLVGAYVLRLQERIDEFSRGTLIDPDPVTGYTLVLDDYLRSHYDATNLALFAQLDGKVAKAWSWSAGVRGETRDADYNDAGNWGGDPARATQASERDDMFGGNVSATYALDSDTKFYVAVARGYKAGGFNFGSARARQPSFKPEFLWNYEAGAKSTLFDGQLYAETTLFYMDRTDMQVRSGVQLVAGDPNSFVFFTSNAAEGYNYGLEASLRWIPVRAVEFGASLGLLRTSAYGLIDADGNLLPPREQAHAPNYQAQLNVTWRMPRGFMMRADYFSNDDFYFDVDHNQRSRPYSLVNLKIGYEAEHWRVHMWSRNLFDAAYATRGFYFGNEPPNFDNKLYIQNGDPRQFGVSVEWTLH